jgi:hypothetical protein
MRRAFILTATAAMAGGLAIFGVQQASADTYYCKVVTAQDMGLYESSTSPDPMINIENGQKFYAVSSDNGRYFGSLNEPSESDRAWISDDPAWTDPC